MKNVYPFGFDSTDFDPCLVIPKRICGWAQQQPLLNDLLSCKYGKALMEAYHRLRTDILYRSPAHGIGHIERVMLLGALIAMCDSLNDTDTEMLMNCCSYHDIGRRNDEYDEQHGFRSAEMIRRGSLCDLFDDAAVAEAVIASHSLPDNRAGQMLEIFHADDRCRYEMMLSYLKDADNTDRVRLADFDPSFLRHESSVTVSRIAEWIFESYERLTTILCFGDSNTFGYNPKNGKRYPAFIRWTDSLQRMLGSDYLVISDGLNGRTIASAPEGLQYKNGLRVIESTLGTHFPIDYLVIMLGTNDCNASLDLSSDDIQRNMHQLICSSRTFLEERQGFLPHIILLSMPAFTEVAENGLFRFSFNKKSLQVSSELADKMHTLAQTADCDFIDLEGKVRCSSVDGIHLTPADHYTIAKILYGYLSDRAWLPSGSK